jgi:hypothetical protein
MTTASPGFWPWFGPSGPPGPQGPVGAGAFLGTTVIEAIAISTSTVSGGTQARVDGWDHAPYLNSELFPTLVAGTADPVLGGWYQIRFNFKVEFANPNEFPQSVRFEQLGYYDSIGVVADFPTFPFDVSAAGGQPRTMPGVQGSVTTGVFFQPYASEVSGPTINPFLYWEGEPEIHAMTMSGEVSKFGNPIGINVVAGGGSGTGPA